MEEKENREERKKNLVLYNVPESNSEEARETRTTEDLSRCSDLFENYENKGFYY